ncbi:MAG: metallophosphoesterase family protein [Bacillota bacterium]|nr:metallophosphoesterase family protein [Bacillota bacterium]
MRIAVFADVHGNLPALDAVLDDARRQRVEQWLCLGDVAFRGPAPEECIRRVRSLGGALAAVQGNTEEWLPVGPPEGEGGDPERRAAIKKWWDWTIVRMDADDLRWVESLPMSRVFECGPYRVLCVHATTLGYEDVLRPTAADERFEAALRTRDHTHAACAHIHTPYLLRVRGTTVFNTGSVGRPIDGDPRASYVVLELGGCDQGRAGAAEAASEVASVQFRRVPYDIDETARLAATRGFPWAEEYIEALRRGVNY